MSTPKSQPWKSTGSRYHSDYTRKHISTPLIGRSSVSPKNKYQFGAHSLVEDFDERPTSTYSILSDLPSRGKSSNDSRSEHSTIYHEHDRRQPIDPKRRFVKTPGPSLPHNKPLSGIFSDGKRESHKIHFGLGISRVYPVTKQEHGYNEIKDIKYDSEVNRPRITLGFFPKAPRDSVSVSERNSSASRASRESRPSNASPLPSTANAFKKRETLSISGVEDSLAGMSSARASMRSQNQSASPLHADVHAGLLPFSPDANKRRPMTELTGSISMMSSITCATPKHLRNKSYEKIKIKKFDYGPQPSYDSSPYTKKIKKLTCSLNEFNISPASLQRSVQRNLFDRPTKHTSSYSPIHSCIGKVLHARFQSRGIDTIPDPQDGDIFPGAAESFPLHADYEHIHTDASAPEDWDKPAAAIMALNAGEI